MTQIPIAEHSPAAPAHYHRCKRGRWGHLSTRARIVALILLAALPFLALVGYSTWDDSFGHAAGDRVLTAIADLKAPYPRQRYRLSLWR